MADQIGVEVLAIGVAAFSRAMRTAQEDLERTANSIKKASGTSAQLGSSLISLGGNMQRLGRAMLIEVSAPLGILTKSLINAGAEFQDNFAGIGKTVEGVSVGFEEIKTAAQRDLGITITTIDEAKEAAERLGMAFGDLTPVGMEVRDQFREMGLEIPVATSEMAALGETVGALGVDSDEIAIVTKLVSALGVATDISGEKAATGLVRMANIMGSTVGPNALSMEDFIRRAGSAIVDLGNKGVSTEGEILEFALRLANAGEMAGWSEQEVLGWAATLADLGAKAQSGGTAVSRALTEMIIAIETGSDNLKLFSGVMGMTNDEFTKFFKEDSSAALAAFAKALEEGIAAGNVSKGMLTDMGLGGVRAFDIIGRLGDAEELLAKNIGNANTAWEEAIALENEAEKRFTTFKSQIQLLKNTFTDLGIEIFDLIEGDLKNLIGFVKDVILWFKGLDDGLKRNLVIFAAIAAVIGPLLIVFGGLITFLGTIATAISALGTVALPVIAILGGLLGLAGAVAGISLLGQQQPAKPEAWEPKSAEEAAQGPPKQVAPIRAPLEVFLDEVGFNKTVESLKKNLKDIGTSVINLNIKDTLAESGLLESIQQFREYVADTAFENFKATLDNIRQFANNFTEAFTPFVDKQGPKIEEIFANLKEAVDKLKPLSEAIQDLGESLGIVSAGDLGTFLGTLAGISFDLLISGIEGLTELIPEVITHVTDIITKITEFVEKIKALPAEAQEGFDTFKENINNFVQATKDSINEFFVDLLGEERVQELKESLGKLGEVFDTLKTRITGTMETAANNTSEKLDKIKGFFVLTWLQIQTDWEAFKTKFQIDKHFEILKARVFLAMHSLKTNLTFLFQDIVDAANNILGQWWTGAKRIIQGFVDGFISLIDGLYNAIVGHSIIPDMLDEILEAFKLNKDNVLIVIGELVQGVISAFSGVGAKVAGGLSSLFSGGTGGGGATEGVEGAEGGEGGGAVAFNAQELQAMQQAIIDLEAAWAAFGQTVTITLDTVNQTLSTLVGITSKLFTNMAISFITGFSMPTQIELIAFRMVFSLQMALLGQDYRQVMLNMVRSTLDFVANSLALLGQFKEGFGQIMTEVQNKGQGSINQLGDDIKGVFETGGVAELALQDFGQTLGKLEPMFGALGSAVRGFVANLLVELAKICGAARDAESCVKGSPELRLQHPFERFEKYLQNTSFGDLVASSLAMPQLENISMVPPMMPSGGTTNVDRSITANIEGLPVDSAENIADVMLRQIRIAETLQGS